MPERKILYTPIKFMVVVESINVTIKILLSTFFAYKVTRILIGILNTNILGVVVGAQRVHKR